MRSIPLALSVLLLCASGCGGSSATREPDEYTGCAGDEQWRTFDDQEPMAMVSDSQGPAVTMPAANAMVPFAMKPLFAWTQSSINPGGAMGDVPHDTTCPEYNTGAIATLHLPPISGNVYDLQFSSGGQIFYRVVTSLQEWLPPDVSNNSMIKAWSAFRGKKVTLKIWRMTLLRNDLVPGTPSGPFITSTPYTFTVGN